MSKKAKIISNSVKNDHEDTETISYSYSPIINYPNADDKKSTFVLENITRKRRTSNADLEYSMMLSDNEYLYEQYEFRDWNLLEKIHTEEKYNRNFVKFLDPKEFSYQYIKKNGFETPLVFKEKAGLGLRVPSENFKVSDVKSCVGSKRVIDVMDVNTQQALTMTMKDWCEYYDNPNRDRLLNVISLEFSHTKLENYVEAPLVVRQLDWIETVWPQNLRLTHTESTNLIEKMKYPKVQKYVLMSVADCYTDFHVDMGGTSVWYHVLKGEKIFWLIPPTDKNLKTYEKWVMKGNQSATFLPDIMDDCQRITLKKGWTFMLPSGWIHAVYTSEDSLVFGGNFLHSFNIPMQLKIYNLESKIKVPLKYRYPFYTEMLWFLIERYVHCYTGITYQMSLDSDLNRIAFKTFEPVNLDLSMHERNGLLAVINFIAALNETKRMIPKEIIQPDELYFTLIKILNEYTECTERIDVDDVPFLHWPKIEKKFLKKSAKNKKEKLSEIKPGMSNSNEKDSSAILSKALEIKKEDYNLNESFNQEIKTQKETPVTESRKHIMRNLPRTKGSIKKRLRPQNIPRSNVERRRRVRCHQCEPCTRDDCGECKYCKDMKKFGGTGISKQCCLSKQCFQPLLPTTTTCMLCEFLIHRRNFDELNPMYECEICFEIYHIDCFKSRYPKLNTTHSIINEDLNNCWQCANCVNKGYIKSENFKTDTNFLEIKSPVLFELSNDSFNTTFSSCKTENLETFNEGYSIFEKSNDIQSKLLPKKRYRRTKLEMEISKRNELLKFTTDYSNDSLERFNHNKNSIKNIISKYPMTSSYDPHEICELNDYSMISVDSLSNYEKQIILNEFCEIYEENEDDYDCQEYQNYDNNDSDRSFENNEPLDTRYINNPIDFDYLSDQDLFIDESQDYIENYAINENYFTDQSSYKIKESSVSNNYSTSTHKSFNSILNTTDENIFNQVDDDYCFIGTSDEEDIISSRRSFQSYVNSSRKNQRKQVNTMQKILNAT